MRESALKAATLCWREITRFRRQRSRVVGALLQPLVFWILLGAGLKASFRPSGMPGEIDYVQYFYPGVIVLVLLFTAIFATITTVEDRKEGFLQGVLVAPLTRDTVVMGQALGGTTLALVQGAIFLVLAPLAGIWPSALGVAAALGLMALIAFALNCIGLAIAWRLESTQGFHAIMNLLLIPLWLLSGAFFPAQGAPAWLWWTIHLNPLTYGMTALRHALYWGHSGSIGPGPGAGVSTAIAAAFALVMFLVAARTARQSRVL